MPSPEPRENPSVVPPPPPRRASLREVVVAVFWSFFGVRKHSAMTRDAATIRPHQVIVVGVVLAALLVFALLGLVRFIVASAT